MFTNELEMCRLGDEDACESVETLLQDVLSESQMTNVEEVNIAELVNECSTGLDESCSALSDYWLQLYQQALCTEDFYSCLEEEAIDICISLYQECQVIDQNDDCQ